MGLTFGTVWVRGGVKELEGQSAAPEVRTALALQVILVPKRPAHRLPGAG